MRTSKVLLGLLALCLAVYLAPRFTSADDATNEVKKVPEVKRTLANVSTQLATKTVKNGFNIECRVMGGMSKTPDHALVSTSIATMYTADVSRGLMKLTCDIDAYRTPAKGALRNKATNAWQDALATKEGVQMTRLLSFPHEVLQKAMAKSEKIEWVWVGDEVAAGEETEVTPAEPKPDAPEGTTAVNPKHGLTEEQAKVKMPHLARITLNKEVALNFWNETKNSGCVSGG